MTEDRAKLDFAGLDEPTKKQRSIDADRIRETSAQAGFKATTDSREERGNVRTSRKRRLKRKRTGRVLQFATRLKAETLDQIYDYAEGNRITLAEVIERAMAALEKAEPRENEPNRE